MIKAAQMKEYQQITCICSLRVFSLGPQINLRELVKSQNNSDTISLSSSHPTLRFYDFGKFDCTQHVDWGIVLHTISYNFSDT